MQRLACVLVLAAAAMLTGVPAAGASEQTSLPGSDYTWAQPGAAFVATAGVQPPSWIPLVAPAVRPATAGTAYAWAQPGTAPVQCAGCQPALQVAIG